MNQREAAKLVAVLAASYPNAKLYEESVTAYHLALSDISYEDATHAVGLLLRTNKFMPAPSEICEKVAETRLDLEPWEDAWAELLRVIQQWGIYRRHPARGPWPGWSSELVERAVNHVGYDNVCLCELDQMGTLRAQFRDVYQREATRRTRAVQTGPALPRTTSGFVALGDGE